MKIQESTVQLAASHEARLTHTQETTTLQGFRQLLASLSAPPADDAATARRRVEKMLQSLVDAVLAAIDGKKAPEKLAGCDELPDSMTATGPRLQEMSWHRTTVECVSESEQTSFCGNGKVRTSDGRAINFDYSLDLARDFSSKKTTETSGTMQLRDPLVINFDGKSTELTQQRIRFDLNADGTAEEIPGLGAANCFLVFDRNGNGKADDGSELFGTASGNGFADLAGLDSDHNGWIDESDPAWQQMAVWSGERFCSLNDAGVGALYTGAVDAPFSLTTGGNTLLGQIRAAGIYLSEAGIAGSLQQVDLAVSGSPAGTEQPAERQKLSA